VGTEISVISCPGDFVGKDRRLLGYPIIDISYGIMFLGKEISMVSRPGDLLGQAQALCALEIIENA